MKCPQCKHTFHIGARTFIVSAVGLRGEKSLAFCDEACAGMWALSEAARLRGWLQRIAARTRGTASGLASQALFSNLTADGTPPAAKRENHVEEEDC